MVPACRRHTDLLNRFRHLPPQLQAKVLATPPPPSSEGAAAGGGVDRSDHGGARAAAGRLSQASSMPKSAAAFEDSVTVGARFSHSTAAGAQATAAASGGATEEYAWAEKAVAEAEAEAEALHYHFDHEQQLGATEAPASPRRGRWRGWWGWWRREQEHSDAATTASSAAPTAAGEEASAAGGGPTDRAGSTHTSVGAPSQHRRVSGSSAMSNGRTGGLLLRTSRRPGPLKSAAIASRTRSVWRRAQEAFAIVALRLLGKQAQLQQHLLTTSRRRRAPGPARGSLDSGLADGFLSRANPDLPGRWETTNNGNNASYRSVGRSRRGNSVPSSAMMTNNFGSQASATSSRRSSTGDGPVTPLPPAAAGATSAPTTPSSRRKPGQVAPLPSSWLPAGGGDEQDIEQGGAGQH